METTEPSKRPLFEQVESITKFSFSLLGFVYAIGFVAVSLFFSQFSVSSLNLIRAQYILAGVWVLLPLVSFLMGLAWVITAIDQQYGKAKDAKASTWKRLWFHVRRIVIGLFVAMGWMYGVATLLNIINKNSPFASELPQDFKSVSSPIPIIMAFGFVIGLLIFTSRTYFKMARDKSQPYFRSMLRAITTASFCIIIFLAYIVYFSLYLYMKIPSTVGGGRPIQVQFMLRNNKEELGATFLEPSGDPLFSKVYWLLLDTEKSYIVLDPQNPKRAIELSKDLVNGFALL